MGSLPRMASLRIVLFCLLLLLLFHRFCFLALVCRSCTVFLLFYLLLWLFCLPRRLILLFVLLLLLLVLAVRLLLFRIGSFVLLLSSWLVLGSCFFFSCCCWLLLNATWVSPCVCCQLTRFFRFCYCFFALWYNQWLSEFSSDPSEYSFVCVFALLCYFFV